MYLQHELITVFPSFAFSVLVCFFLKPQCTEVNNDVAAANVQHTCMSHSLYNRPWES